MGISGRGTRAKTITSCDNAFVTNIVLAQAAHRMPMEALLCAKAKRQRQCFICAKAKRQQQSAQPERKSTTSFGSDPFLP
ncbi:hypothetical protein [Lysinibacillus xylanilyticus]|uniref:hypothetical protein n=1 Tax=Lysinibacillus xylanilyticus TaxID=582475 RepID=UPI002B255657|nr:hypothetical protein [Lysinibacillus xylanilyticus]